MKKNFMVQSCDSKECYKLEKDMIGIKNVDVITRVHEYNEETNELICINCGKITKIINNKKK